MRRVVFQCDGGATVGVGHVARCIQVACAFRRGGDNVVFWGSYDGFALEMLQQNRFQIQQTQDSFHGAFPNVDILVTDSYDQRHNHALLDLREKEGIVTASFFDYSHPLPTNIHINYHQKRYDSVASALCGASYVPVDPQLVSYRVIEKREDPYILITLGGGNSGQYLINDLVASLRETQDAQIIVIGSFEIDKSLLAQERIQHIPFSGQLREYLAGARLLVSGAGVTAYEAACGGVPSLFIQFVDNQRFSAQFFVDNNIAPVIDMRSGYRGSLFRDAVEEVFCESETYRLQGPRCIDGYGVFRIRDALVAFQEKTTLPRVLRYRPATFADAGMLFAWRNDAAVRAVSGNSESFTFSSHQTWLTKTLRNGKRKLLIAEYDGESVGVVRFDFGESVIEISITVAPGSRQAGFGQQIIRESSELMLAAYPLFSHITARVHSENHVSLRSFQQAGYAMREYDGDWAILWRKFDS